jgi:hypothetical protein
VVTRLARRLRSVGGAIRIGIIIAGGVAVTTVGVVTTVVAGGGGGTFTCNATVTGGGTSGTALNIGSSVTSTPAGTNLCLNAGWYSFDATISKTSMTTIRAAAGHSQTDVNFTSLLTENSNNLRFQDFTAANDIHLGNSSAPSTNVQIANFTSLGGMCVESPGLNADHILVDRGYFGDILGACGEGRFELIGDDPNGNNFGSGADMDVQVTNTTFENPDTNPVGSDGIETTTGARGLIVGPGDQFLNIKENQGNCQPTLVHCDAISPFASTRTKVIGDYFYMNSQPLGNFSCTNVVQVTDNISIAENSSHNFDLSGESNALIAHNTIVGPAGLVVYGGNPGNCTNTGTIRDNVVSGLTVSNFTGTQTNNVTTFTLLGGTSPTTWAGFALTSPLGTATDGGNVGARMTCAPGSC